MTDLTPTTGSTPFPLEEQGQTEKFQDNFELWDHPSTPHWYSGLGFTEDNGYFGPFASLGSGAAKGEAVLGGIINYAGRATSNTGQPGPVTGELGSMLQRSGEAIESDAKMRVKALTPNPATTGLAAQMLHSVGESTFLLAAGGFGGPGAAILGGVEGGSRYEELRDKGVDQGTAAASGALAGVTSAAGALIPAAYGSTLATRLLTGAAGNTAFGMANRYADHAILEAGGYHEMAEQQKGWDGTQMLVDAALGATFGAIHHAGAAEEKAVKALRSPDNRDAAMSMNLALRDRGAAPGVPIDPQAAAAHQAAMEKASSDLLQGKPVDVSDTGVNQASFLARPTFENPTAAKLMVDSFKESGFLDEEANLRDLENQFAKRTGQPEQPAIERKPIDHAAAEERRTQASYMPAETELHAAGGGRTPQNESQVATVARAHELNPEGVALLAKQHQDNPHAFVEASQGLIDEHRAAASGSPGRGGAEAENAGGAGRAEPGSAATAAAAGAESGAGTEPTPTSRLEPVHQAFAERPALKVPDEAGKPVDAMTALARTNADAQHAEAENPMATQAAVDCFARKGG